MTSRLNESSGSNICTQSDARPNQVSLGPQREEEGCPVVEESGTACGETSTFNVFQDFRAIYDNFIRKMEGNKDDNLALKKLAPFRKLVEDLWEQNAMLVKTVEELEQEAASKVTVLQNKLDECSEKDIENLLKQKDREICCLTKELSSKNELLGKYYSQIDELKRDLRSRSRKHQQVLNRLKDAAAQRLSKFPTEDFNADGRELDDGALEVLFNTILKEMDNQKLKFTKLIQEAEYDVRNISLEKNNILSEKTDMKKCLEDLRSENCSLRNELAGFNGILMEKERLHSRLEEVKRERDQLLEKVNSLHHNIQELDTSFKETRWALTAEVAEKHDQIQELKRTLVCLEEQVRQADMKTLFKDDVIKEMRKELKNSRLSVYTLENITKVPVQNIPFGDKKSWNLDLPVKENFEEDLKLDIHIFPLQENNNQKTLITRFKKYFSENICSVEVQTENKKKMLYKTRNVSTQHTPRVQKLPRSFGTLTVKPWSGAVVERPVGKFDSRLPVDDTKKLKKIFPCSSLS